MSVATVDQSDIMTLPVIEFVAPMPGFPAVRRFVLVEVDDSGLLYAMTALDDPDIRFLVVPPGPFFSEYEPEVDDETMQALEVVDANELLVLLVVSAGDKASEATVNLMAPIVVHQPTRRAVQLILTGSGLPVRARLLAA
jgi:flagellar assembly factor FliW